MNTDIFRKAVVPVSAGVAGLLVGGVLGFLVGQRRERRNRLRMIKTAEQTSVIRSPETIVDHPSFEKLYEVGKDGKVPYYSMHPGVKELVDDIRSKDVEVDRKIPIDPELEALLDEEDAMVAAEEAKRQNAFAHPYSVADDTWDWERELSERSNKPIYVITAQEYKQGEMGFRQGTIIFYEGDRMMTDELGEPIYNWTSHVGTELPFGHGTGDENIVFIRNESLKWEYEIQRDPGDFDIEVKGHDIQMAYEEDDLKHMHQPLKMRRE